MRAFRKYWLRYSTGHGEPFQQQTLLRRLSLLALQVRQVQESGILLLLRKSVFVPHTWYARSFRKLLPRLVFLKYAFFLQDLNLGDSRFY